ncbi:hypothetical protein NPIL_434131 [Nephila pilipes]|uniref:Uncharacterized protein n=1 Tax=Nephila pilipes TaxID=299642 RepID=A0A8X6NNF2_NEPPI|nr:hypothetical protein NPIL_434131 [Nephila pilipes]
MEPTERTISEILFEDEDMPFDSDDEIITECSQDFLEASPFFENLPSQFGNGMELEDAIILEERSRRRNNRFQAEEIIFRARIDEDRLPHDLRGIMLSTVVNTVRRLRAFDCENNHKPECY